MSEPSIRVGLITPEQRDALLELLGAHSHGCYCRYWHFTEDKNAWQLACAAAPEDNRSWTHDALTRKAPEATGFVAMAGPRAVGWLKLAPKMTLDKLYGGRPYRGLPCLTGPSEGVYAIGCTLVDPEYRKRGIARELLRAAIDWARGKGMIALEAFPRRGELLRDADLWMGPAELYLELGFSAVSDFAPYPVLRLELAHAD